MALANEGFHIMHLGRHRSGHMQHFLLTIRMWPANIGPFGQHPTSTTKVHVYSKHIYVVLWELGFLMHKLSCKPTCSRSYPTSSETYVIYWHTLRITQSSVFVEDILWSPYSMDCVWPGSWATHKWATCIVESAVSKASSIFPTGQSPIHMVNQPFFSEIGEEWYI